MAGDFCYSQVVVVVAREQLFFCFHWGLFVVVRVSWWAVVAVWEVVLDVVAVGRSGAAARAAVLAGAWALLLRLYAAARAAAVAGLAGSVAVEAGAGVVNSHKTLRQSWF